MGTKTIREELLEVTEISAKRGESDADLATRLVRAVSDLPDEDWNKLSKEAQAWFNAAADAVNNKEDPPSFPDDEQEDKPTRGRSSSKKDEESESDDYEPEADDQVVIVTKRGKEIKGKVVEVGDDFVVVDTGDGEEELNRDRIKSITKQEDKPARGRSSSKKDDEQEDKPTRGRSSSKKDEESAEKQPRTRSVNSEGVSATTRMRELIVEDMEASVEDIGKALKKEGFTFRDNTLSLVYSDVHKLLGILKAHKKLK